MNFDLGLELSQCLGEIAARLKHSYDRLNSVNALAHTVGISSARKFLGRVSEVCAGTLKFRRANISERSFQCSKLGIRTNWNDGCSVNKPICRVRETESE